MYSTVTVPTINGSSESSESLHAVLAPDGIPLDTGTESDGGVGTGSGTGLGDGAGCGTGAGGSGLGAG